MADTLAALLNPASVAVIGASEDTDKIGGRPLAYMKRFGYQGLILPINPKRDRVQDIAAYPSLAALSAAPELALIAVGGDQASEAIDQCASIGVKAAIVIASGFGETGAAGLARQDAMRDRARAAGMRLVGPNTQGLANFGNGAIACFSTMFLELPPQDGPVAVISQSGGMSAMTYGLLRQAGIGVRHVHATGNEADVTVADLTLAVVQDPGVQLVLLYLESIGKPELLAEAAAIARQRGIPIVAVKSGQSVVGQRAASSHTGAIATQSRVVDAFFAQHGIWRVRDPHELARTAGMYLQGWRPTGRKLVVISNSGASCVMGADVAETVGLELAPLADATQVELARRLPGFASTGNPVDITAALLSNNRLFGDVLPVIGEDPATDLFFINIPVAGQGYDIDTFAADAAAFAAQTGKPVAIAAWQDKVAAAFRARGLPAFRNEAEAVGALAQLADHTALLGRTIPAWPTPAAVSLPTGNSRFLSEAASLAVLREQGIAVIDHRLCRSADEAVEAWRQWGRPVVLKACSADIPHKSELGLVGLRLNDEASLCARFAQHQDILDRHQLSAEGQLLAPMHAAPHELAVGASVDPVFGPVVMIGAGGKYVEAIDDTILLMPPFSAQDVRTAVGRLRIAPVLAGVRGEAPADLDALADLVVAVGRFMLAAQGQVASVDLNPVMVGVTGEGALAVDGLIERVVGHTIEQTIKQTPAPMAQGGER